MVTQTLMPVSLTKILSKKSEKRTEMTRIYGLSASSDTHIAHHHPCPDTICLVLHTNKRRHTLNLLKFKE